MLKKHMSAGWRYAGVSFLLVQTVFVSVAIVAATSRYRQLDRRLELPELQASPYRVSPLYDDSRVITDEQIQRVLHKLRPRLRHSKPKINHVDHALRFWGVEAEFTDPDCLSGLALRQLLVDHRQFKAKWGAAQPPLLIDRSEGVAVRTREGLATASHVDHTLATLSEVGTPLEYAIVTDRGPRTMRDLLEQSLRSFSLNQLEYEWSATAYASYLPPVQSWFTSEGQRITFNDLADRLMRQRLNQGVCMGNHRLHALVILLRIDEQTPILTEECRQRVLAHLADATRRYIASQHMDGYWLRSWPAAEKAHDLQDENDDTLTNRVLATGHVLEWWALAPAELHPPREVVIRAGQWLTRTVLEMDEDTIRDNYTYLTHAGRALALWRGRFPHEIYASPTLSTR